MKKLLVYIKDFRLECVLAPLFKLLEASFELIVPLRFSAPIIAAEPNRPATPNTKAVAPNIRQSSLIISN